MCGETFRVSQFPAHSKGFAMSIRVFVLPLLLIPILAGCQTTPPPCSQDWVEFKTDKILHGFASDNRSLINDLRKLQNADGDLNAIITVRLMSNPERLERFVESFTNRVVPELESALLECGQSEEFVPALTEFLRDEGVSEKALEWVGPIMGVVQEMQQDQANRPLTP